MKEIIIVAGIAKNGVIGHKGKLPWHISEDLKHFKELTWGNPVIMGRATYLSVIEYLGGPLPGRTNIVLTKNPLQREGFIMCGSLEEALREAEKHGEKLYVIGGQSVYEQFMDKANKLELTEIYRDFEGDSHFPELKKEMWKELKRENKKGANFEFSFVTYEKKDNNVHVWDDAVDKSKENDKGVFIAFEGVDGCGKSTQIRMLVQHIFELDKYNHIILTRNPYHDVNIRKILHEDDNPYSKADKLAEMYINDRRKQTEHLIIPNLKSGHFILTDRYKISSIVYQATQGLDIEDLIDRQKDLPVPNMTFIIDVPVEEAIKRMKNEDVAIRGKEHKFEANMEFIKKLRDNHFKAKELLEKSGEKVFIINGEGTPEEVFGRVREIFDREIRR